MTDEKSKDDGFDIPYTVKNPEQLAQNMMRMMNVGAQALSVWLDDKRADNPQKLATEWNEAGSVIAKVMSAWATEPEKFAERQAMLTGNLIDLWGRTNRRFMGEKVEPLVQPAVGDGRFRDPEWSENPFFDFCKQAYLLSTNWANDMISDAEGVTLCVDAIGTPIARANLRVHGDEPVTTPISSGVTTPAPRSWPLTGSRTSL
jgi:polyhydroxyalkanoate synthase